jgi:osmotically-inducible protein OsmY
VGKQKDEPEEDAMLRMRTIAVLAMLALGACTENDTHITQRVQDRLAVEGVAPEQVHVSTLRRVVVLEGVVNDNAELNRAEMAARQVPGIMGIDNRLVVKNPVNTTGATPEEKRAP